MTAGRALRRLLLAAGLVVAATATGTGPADDAPVEAAPDAQRVLLVSDSVGLGTRGVLDDFFPPEWEVNVVGTPAYFVEQLHDLHVVPAITSTPWRVGDHVVIAGGYNYPFWDPDRFDRSIDQMIATLTAAGVEHIYWVTLREVKPQFISASAWRQVQPYYWYFPTVNEHLRQALVRHPNLSLVDWAAAADRPGITYDAIHLNRTGAELYSGLIRQAVDNAANRPGDGTVTPVDVTDVPGADAVAVNLTAVGARRKGHATAFACDEGLPRASQLVYQRASAAAAAAIVPVDDQGRICVRNHTASHVLVDVTGTFDADAGLGGGNPNRVFDSRVDPASTVFGRFEVTVTDADDSVPDGPVALSVGAVGPTGRSHVTIHPCESEPTTVTVNTPVPGRNRSNLVLVEPSPTGTVCVEIVGAPMHLTIDRFTTFSDPVDGAIRILTPDRIVNTRLDDDRLGAGEVLRFSLTDTALGDLDEAELDAVTGVAFNLGIIRPDVRGHATAWPCELPRPATSNINYGPDDVVSNLVIVRPDSAGEICVSSLSATHLTIDVLAAFGDGFVGQDPVRVLNTRTG